MKFFVQLAQWRSKKELQVCTCKKSSNRLLFKKMGWEFGGKKKTNDKIEITNTKAVSGLLYAGSCSQVRSSDRCVVFQSLFSVMDGPNLLEQSVTTLKRDRLR